MTTLMRDVGRNVRDWPIFVFYVAATLATATIVGLITINVIDLGMRHFGEAAYRTHDVAYGALFTTLVVGTLLQIRRPHHNVAGMAMAIVPSASLLLAGLLVEDLDRVFEFNPLRYAAAVTVVTALLHPAGRGFFRSFRARSISWPMTANVAIAALPLLSFASTNLELQRDLDDIHTFMGHYGFMAALCFAIIGVGLLASLRPTGWRLPVWMAAGLAAVLGTTSLLEPDAASSLDTGWAVTALAWAAAFVTVGTHAGDPPRPATAQEPRQVATALPTR